MVKCILFPQICKVLNFQHHFSSLQYHMILQKSAQETLIIINVENNYAA